MRAARIVPPPTACWRWRSTCAATGTTARRAATPAAPCDLRPPSAPRPAQHGTQTQVWCKRRTTVTVDNERHPELSSHNLVCWSKNEIWSFLYQTETFSCVHINYVTLFHHSPVALFFLFLCQTQNVFSLFGIKIHIGKEANSSPERTLRTSQGLHQLVEEFCVTKNIKPPE